ncbi:MAG: mannose-1-phosphate guanylyltransferase, partial [Candidatus Coatesbacteria bacterium]|nr:mannose-1-phosphate guanylyltransferase [Candidatus Coatesbacteria bacterium]
MFGVIMAGGSGTRLWPQSRKQTPKHLLALVGGRTMLQMTFDRVASIIPPSRILVVTLDEQVPAIRKCLTDISPENIIAEPASRNTAPCIGLAALVVRSRCPGATMAVMPADHVISNEHKFAEVLELAALELEREPDALITVGIPPRHPATGFGYIEKGRPIASLEGSDLGSFEAMRFVEKPPLSRARQMFEEGGFLWNSGLFFWRTDTILGMIEQHLPELHSALRLLDAELEGRRSEQAMASIYEGITPISIDYGVMQKAEKVLVIEGDMGWDDVGSWASLSNIWPADEAGCASNCELIAV